MKNKLIYLQFLTMMMTMMIMILLVHADMSVAISEKVNGSFNGVCGGGVDCIIGSNFDLEAEFPMESRVARMLFDIGQSITSRYGNQNQASVSCPQTQSYRSCLPPPNGGAPIQQCNDFNRAC